jgi:hypothetical protein
VPLRNRVDPTGDLHAHPARGLLTGNRGCLVDDDGTLLRHHQVRPWIVCVLSYRDRRQPLAAPRRWTPLFHLDDASALAAGHRPCGLCRRAAYQGYQAAVARGLGLDRPPAATTLDTRLAAERLRRGRGLERAGDRLTWRARSSDLPDGTVVLVDGEPRLLVGGRCLAFGFDGWEAPGPGPVPVDAEVEVLTPPTSVLALANGFEPLLHPSAR